MNTAEGILNWSEEIEDTLVASIYCSCGAEEHIIEEDSFSKDEQTYFEKIYNSIFSDDRDITITPTYDCPECKQTVNVTNISKYT